jgi:hypothetical protein
MQEKRGFHFLIGLAVLWLLWRLYAAGIIFQAVAYAFGPDAVACYCQSTPIVASGPGAIIVAFAIEAIITIGWVVTLLVSGIWDGLVVLGGFVGDGFNTAHTYVKGGQVELSQPSATAEASKPAASVVQSTGDPEKDAITLLSQQVVYLAGELKTLKEAKA